MQSILGPLVNALTWVLNWLHSAGLTWGLSIIGLTIIVRLILFPLTWKQYKSAQEMQAIQPQIKALQKKYKNDRGKLQEETMKLYQEHHVNPFASCLPLVLQLPIFISLYYAIRGEQDLADATFLGIPLGAPSVILLIVYVLTQIVSTELMLVTQSDKTQKMIMRAMPLIFVFVLRSFRPASSSTGSRPTCGRSDSSSSSGGPCPSRRSWRRAPKPNRRSAAGSWRPWRRRRARR